MTTHQPLFVTSLKLLFAGALATTFATILCSSQAAPIVLNPTADAYVATGSPTNPSGDLRADNFGGGGALVLAAPGLPNGEFQTLIKFNLASATTALNAQFGVGQWTVQSVTLQLTASAHGNPIYNAPAAGMFNVSLMQNSSWTEGTGTASIPTTDGITYNTLQSTYINSAVDQALGTFSFNGGSSGATTGSLTLSSGLLDDLANGSTLGLRLYAADNMISYLLSSRNDVAANRPELIITAVPEPGTLALGGLGLAMFALAKRRRH